MPLPVIAGVVRCAVQGITPVGTKWTNVHHMQYALGASNPGPTEITAMDALFTRLYTGTIFTGGNNWFSNCPGGLQLVQIDYVNLDGASNGLTIPHAVNLSGASAQPSEVAHVLTLITGHRGRRYRGRIYMPGASITNMTATGQLNASAASSIRTQYLGMLGALAGIQWVPVVASYGHGTSHGAPSTWSPFATPITDVRMDVTPDVQRRRKL